MISISDISTCSGISPSLQGYARLSGRNGGQFSDQLTREHPECIEKAHRLARSAANARNLNADELWNQLIWNKPIFSNNRVGNAGNLIAEISPLMVDAWRAMSHGEGAFAITIVANYPKKKWKKNEAHNVTGETANKLVEKGLAAFRLYAIVNAGVALRRRVEEHGEHCPFGDIFATGLFEPALAFRHLENQLGRGWGDISILHLMTDFGIAVKPDLHLVRTTREIGLHDFPKDTLTQKRALEVVSRVRCLVCAIEGTLTPYSLRVMDKMLMDISEKKLLEREGE